jgi:hypothetical protein
VIFLQQQESLVEEAEGEVDPMVEVTVPLVKQVELEDQVFLEQSMLA